MTQTLKHFFAASFMIFFLSQSLQAQQTIINLPSADQTPKGKWFFLHESQIRTTDPTYWITTNFLTYGLTDEIELAATQYQFGTPRQPYTAIGFGYKGTKQFFETSLPEWELKLSFGQMFPISTTGRGVGIWTYGFGSFRLPYLKTRLALGMGYGPRQNFGISVLHTTASFEQPLFAHINFLGEWFSGSVHENAFFIPGLNYHAGNLILILGYKISNLANFNANDGIVFEVGWFF
ncbi:MAG: hypothetical protein SFU91_15340 [Chloroherpetonaceae bacterium]|nr:hypothetical protein [Chloroherpetonaceae bacterium]